MQLSMRLCAVNRFFPSEVNRIDPLMNTIRNQEPANHLEHAVLCRGGCGTLSFW